MSSLFSPRIGLRDLAQLCRRLAIALSSGIEVRRVIEREAANARGSLLRAKLRIVSDAVARGDTMAEGFERTGDYFPDLLHEIVNVGEHTGHLAEVFKHLAEHYEEQVRLRRSFMSSITGPLIQLGLAIGIIGIMILVLGAIAPRNGSPPMDILGLGLIGEEGFVVYCLIVGSIAAGGYFLFQAMRRGVAWTEPVQRTVLSLPGIGGPLRTIALGQMAWTMELTLEAGMEIMKAMQLSLASTRNSYYTSHTSQVVSSIRAGNEVHEALTSSGAFPFEFVTAVEVGERSGRLPESMKTLSKEYHERARHAVQTLTTLAGWGVWAMVALMIIVMIFRIFSSYLNVLNDAMKM
jgi:type IV pilus assembly protein PilC